MAALAAVLIWVLALTVEQPEQKPGMPAKCLVIV